MRTMLYERYSILKVERSKSLIETGYFLLFKKCVFYINF